ncbi:MAG TPA: hypothetical protein VGN59_10035 [Acidimicrobiia bacterium]|jgi:hypothetical protein
MSTNTYAVTIQTLDRLEGNGITLVMVEADDPVAAEVQARRVAEAHFDCLVIADDALLWPA